MGPERSDLAPFSGPGRWCALGAFIGALVGWILWMVIGNLVNAGSTGVRGTQSLGSALVFISSPVGILGGAILGAVVGFIIVRGQGYRREIRDSQRTDSMKESGHATKVDSVLD